MNVVQEQGLDAVKTIKIKKKKKFIIITVVILLVVGVIVFLAMQGGKGAESSMASNYEFDTVSRRDIVSTLSGSGMLEPADSYTMTSLVSGEILEAQFEEGDKVFKDDVLYHVDSEDVQIGVEKVENAVSKAQLSYNSAVESLADLQVLAKDSGVIVQVLVSEGDQVSPGQTLATIRESDTMEVKMPFPTEEAALFTVGQSALVTVDGSFETLTGTVTEIAAAEEVLTGNRIVRQVSMSVVNPGAITSQTTATAQIGASACAGSGTFAYETEKIVTAKVSGEVESIVADDGARVSTGDVVLVLSNDGLSDAVKNAALTMDDAGLSLDGQMVSLENYQIQAPIDGTVIEKTLKKGDNVEIGVPLCIIYNLDYMTFIMNIDELDISKVAVGQDVTITVDAVANQEYVGKVTKISINATASPGGVTSYPVTVRIDNAKGLLPGMNVDAKLIVGTAKDVLSIPVEALSRGNVVLVKSDAPTQSDDKATEKSTESLIPEGYAPITAEIGISDNTYIQIISGMEDGDAFAFQPSSSGSLTPEQLVAMTMEQGMGMPMGGGR